eukprot:scaffold80646_cov31-Attheya_sp.AAC.2
MPIKGGVGEVVCLRRRIRYTRSRRQQKNNFNVMVCRDARMRTRTRLGDLREHTSRGYISLLLSDL